MYELVIVGGGPAAVAAGVYAARKQIKTLLITESFGGQSLVSNDIQNWIGTKSLSGLDLAKNLEEHLRSQDGTLEILTGELVNKVEAVNGAVPKGHFKIFTKGGKSFEAHTILMASGSRRRRLGVPGEDKLDGRGVAFCTTCDAPLFKGKAVAIVGGGNSALEGALDAIPYVTSVTLVARSELKGDPITQEKIKAHPKVKILLNAVTEEILGDTAVTGLRYKDLKTGGTKEIAVQGVFVEIGSTPNSEFVKGLVDLDERSEIIVDHKTQRTSLVGIWAAGDVSDVIYKQNNISAGDAVKAILNIYEFLHKNHLTHAHK